MSMTAWLKCIGPASFTALFLLLLPPPLRGQAGPFPDAHDPPPSGWTGPVFKLRQDYPATLPTGEPKPWKNFDFKTQPLEYIRSVLGYCLEGNVDVNWQVERNSVRAWYHAPWMHSTNNGREFVHGLTRERSSVPRELHPDQSSSFQNWAVSVYNAPGGFVIGQVWKNPNSPNAAAAVFPDGTVAVKLLFSTATVAQVPYLQGSVEWQAHIYKNAQVTQRTIETVQLLQVDVAVRDSRADSTTGWVFGTFVYDGSAAGATPWQRLVPVGVMWGNDPQITSPTATATTQLTQTFINPNIGPPQHLGRAKRLNGPVDNPRSSCLSCHSTSEYHQISGMVPGANLSNTQTMRWFQNIKAAQAFDAGEQSLDYSLQLAVGIQRFLQAHPSAVVTTAPAAAGGPSKHAHRRFATVHR